MMEAASSQLSSSSLAGAATLLKDRNFLGVEEFSSMWVVLLSLLPVGPVEGGIFSRITMSSTTSAWRLRLSHFEAVLVQLVVLQIFVMSYLTILPLDLSKLFQGGELLATSYSKRRKRSMEQYSRIVEQQRLAETMFSILRRLDEDDCLLRMLCELEANRAKENNAPPPPYPNGILKLLSNLKRLGHDRIRRESTLLPNNVTVSERKVLSAFEDAVLFGSSSSGGGGNEVIWKCGGAGESNLPEESSCADRYALCEAEKDELLHYVKEMEPFLS